MKPNTLGVYQLFENHRRYVVPLYQRPYVWTRDEHWIPLWDDIRDRAEAVLRADRDREAQRQVHPHFLGAIVTNQRSVFGREVHAYDVIDGQQRLTTLQLFLAAFRDVVAQVDESLHEDLKELTRNTKTVDHDDERYKVWPTNADRRAYKAVLDAGSKDAVERFVYDELAAFRRRPPLAEAYICFYDLINDWVNDDDLEAPGKSPTERIDAVFDAAKRLLQVVEIGLEDGDDPQVIFETLNARGAPLLPSDLVRNYVFTQASRRRENTDALYDTYWREFEDIDAKPFWKSEQTVGREKRQRFVVFLYHFLAASTAEELSVSHLYVAFKRWWESKSGPGSVEEGLRTLREYAAAYRKIVEPDTSSRFGVFAKRLQVLDVSTLHPVLLHLLVDRELSKEDLGSVVTSLESYLVRRTVCRLTAKNLNRFFLGLIHELRSRPDDPTRELVRNYLAVGQGDSVRWPSDQEFKTAWLHSPSYRRIRSGNVSMILEALDRHRRTGYQEGVHLEKSPTVEHVMPQAWRTHWPEPSHIEGDETAEARRDRLIHTFGNLTLLTQGLNSKVGNAPFVERRDEIIMHTELRLNTYFHHVADWDEEEILKRGNALFPDATKVWGHPGTDQWTKPEAPVAITEDEPESTNSGPELIAAVVEEFAKQVPPNTALRGKAHYYRKVIIATWPSFLHYEFNFESDQILVGLHLEASKEHRQHAAITEALELLIPSLQEGFPGYDVGVVERSRNWRWITVPFSVDVPLPIVAEAMRRLIDLTRPSLSALLTSEEPSIGVGDNQRSSTSS